MDDFTNRVKARLAAESPKSTRADGRNLLGLDCPLNAVAKYSGGALGRSMRFPNAIQDWRGTPRTLREKAMVTFMNQITDKPDWTRKIGDDEIVRKWKDEAAKQAKKIEPQEALSERMIDYCIEELGDYAKEFEKHHFVPAIRATATVFKSDSLISEDVKLALRIAASPLEDVPDKYKDWHPDSDEKVLDLVHPSLFPLMYGKSRILDDGVVTLEDCEKFTGKGSLIPVPHSDHLKVDRRGSSMFPQRTPDFYSAKFQWLPCEVSFEEDDRVQIRSYINNLHPRGNEKLYGAIEDIIARTIPMWDATLAAADRRRKMLRILVNSPYYIEPEGKWEPMSDDDEDEDGHDEYEWERLNRTIIMPEPGEYNPNKDDADKNSGYKYPILHFPKQPEMAGKKGLRQMFATKGLQIIVKLANIHLTPDRPTYDGGSWHVEGQLNEHICASALYYYDSENITDSYLSFREMIQTDDFDHNDYEQSEYEHLEVLYGIQNNKSAVQELGRVLTREGRLLVFPNVFQHQVSPFKLADPTRPGHRKILALFLVDPFCRIPSTANVPPQQKEWWRDMVQSLDRVGDLPVELADRIVDSVEDFPIGLDEAKKIRLELMEERKTFAGDVDKKYRDETFNFCEH